MLVASLKICNVSRQTAGVEAKADTPRTESPAIAGFLLGDYSAKVKQGNRNHQHKQSSQTKSSGYPASQQQQTGYTLE
jgi:hypothetical protein